MKRMGRYFKIVLLVNLMLTTCYVFVVLTSINSLENPDSEQNSATNNKTKGNYEYNITGDPGDPNFVYSQETTLVTPVISVTSVTLEKTTTDFPEHVLLSTIVLNNPNACNSSKKTKTDLVIIVLSARDNFLQRRLVRETWGSIRVYNNVTVTAVMFFLGHIGQPGEDVNLSVKIEAEANKFKDIVTGEFVDTYRNLSRKSILAYEWVSLYCSTPDIVVKTDDDVMLNIFQLTRELEITPVLHSDVFHCAIHYQELPIRGDRPGYEIYYVTYDEIPGKYFPKHCAGVGYPIRMNLARRIVSAMKAEPHMCTHEDVYVTGILTERINALTSNVKDQVTLENKQDRWYLWPSDGNAASYEALLKLSEERQYNETNIREIFHRAYGTVLFFLLNHGQNFENDFLRLWERVLVDTWTKHMKIN